MSTLQSIDREYIIFLTLVVGLIYFFLVIIRGQWVKQYLKDTISELKKSCKEPAERKKGNYPFYFGLRILEYIDRIVTWVYSLIPIFTLLMVLYEGFLFFRQQPPADLKPMKTILKIDIGSEPLMILIICFIIFGFIEWHIRGFRRWLEAGGTQESTD